MGMSSIKAGSLGILVTFVVTHAPMVETKFSPVKCNNLRLQKGNLTVFNLSQKPPFPPIDEICAEIGPIIYECVDGVCCTPGDPDSLCCPLFAPLCVPEGCCAAGHPKVCMDTWCCEETDVCCPGGCCEAGNVCCPTGCCEGTEFCCGSGCCDIGTTCCGGLQCCDANQTCCSTTCCDQGQHCCGDHGDQCCSDSINYTCEKQAFNAQCPFPFDALDCTPGVDYKHFIDVLHALSPTCPTTKELRRLYRVLRDDESCESGLTSKTPTAKQSIQSYLNCATLPSYKSQFMSFTSSPEVAMAYLKVSDLKRIGVVEVRPSILDDCEVLPMANMSKTTFVKSVDPLRQKIASLSCEILLVCKEVLPCYEISV